MDKTKKLNFLLYEMPAQKPTYYIGKIISYAWRSINSPRRRTKDKSVRNVVVCPTGMGVVKGNFAPIRIRVRKCLFIIRTND